MWRRRPWLLGALLLVLVAPAARAQSPDEVLLMLNWKNADGTPVPARVGPLQLIVTGENRPGRWVRQLVALEVKPLP